MRRRKRADPAQPALYSLILLALGSVHDCLEKKTRSQTRPESTCAFRKEHTVHVPLCVSLHVSVNRVGQTVYLYYFYTEPCPIG